MSATLEQISGYTTSVRPSIAGTMGAARRVVLSNPPENGTVWTVECPSLRGCISEGDTPEQALENIKDAMEGWLFVALEYGDYIPPSDAR